jgi:hypothetical protein
VALALRFAASRQHAPTANDGSAISPALAKTLWSLRLRYLTVFLAMKFADWLQGPYFYEVYAAKTDAATGAPFSSSTISFLFLVGFCSAMVFGAFAGSWADKFGR